MKVPALVFSDPFEMNSALVEAEKHIQPSEIESFAPCDHGSTVNFKSGGFMICKLTPEQLEKSIAGYWMHVSKIMSKEQNPLVIV